MGQGHWDVYPPLSKPTVRLCVWLALTSSACATDRSTEPAASAPSPTASVVATYTARDLGTLGGPNSRASDVNNAGIIVGQSSTTTGVSHAFRWQDGVMTDLGTLGGDNSGAVAITNEGLVVGWSQNRFGRTRAVRWVSGVPRSLGTLGGPASEATGVNASGWIVGWSLSAAGEQHAFLWKNGAMTDLGTLGGPLSVATAINAAGTVVGYSTKASGALARKYPFRWRDGVMRELPSLPGTGIDNYAMPWAIQGGVVVGVGAPDGADGDVSHALVWSGGTLTDLGRLGGDYTRASDVNGAGVVVGSIDYNPPDCVGMDAFVVQEGEVTLLPPLGGRNEFSGAMAINRAGWVVGFSETPLGSGDCEAGEVHATLWRPN